MEMTTCHRCGTGKPATPEFFNRRSNRRGDTHALTAICKVCIYTRRTVARKANLPKVAARQRAHRNSRPPEELEKARERARQWYYDNREKAIAKTKARRDALRYELLTAYGGECACCGEDNPLFLTVDHVNGNGRAHRRSLLQTNGTTPSEMIMRDLKQRGWPKDEFQLLCFNCNCGRARNGGVCPHQVTSRTFICDGNLSSSSP
jgi:hypothetical protein